MPKKNNTYYNDYKSFEKRYTKDISNRHLLKTFNKVIAFKNKEENKIKPLYLNQIEFETLFQSLNLEERIKCQTLDEKIKKYLKISDKENTKILKEKII